MNNKLIKLPLLLTLFFPLWGCESSSKPPIAVNSPLDPLLLTSPLPSPISSPTPPRVVDFVITTSLTSPQDLKVKNGEFINKGQIVSQNSLKYQALAQKYQEIEAKLQQKMLPIPLPTLDIKRQEAELAKAKIFVAQAKQNSQQIQATLRFKDPALSEALDRDKVQQMRALETQQKFAEQKIVELTKDIKTAQENYLSAISNQKKAEQKRQEDVKLLLTEMQQIKQQVKTLFTVSPVSGQISQIQVKKDKNKALTAKISIKPAESLNTVTLPPPPPVPNVNPLPQPISGANKPR